jgi:hypothetical protein
MGKWKTFTLEEVGGEEAGEEKEEGEGEEEEAKERTSGRRDSESRYLQRGRNQSSGGKRMDQHERWEEAERRWGKGTDMMDLSLSVSRKGKDLAFG